MNKATKSLPLVSVILPVYKSEAYLESCLESLLAQTYKNIEIVAVVDYLGDNSLKILKQYRKKDKRIRVYSNLQRYGLASTLNRAISRSRGQYIAFMDSSGVALKTRIAKQVKYLAENPKVAAVGTQVAIIDVNDREITKSELPLIHEEIYKHLVGGISMKFETVTLDRSRLPKDILSFKRNTPYPFAYVDVFMKIGLYNELANINNRLVLSREIVRENKQILNLNKKLSFVKILFNAAANYEYKPSLRALFVPLLRQS